MVVSRTGGAFTGRVTDPPCPFRHRCRDVAGCSHHAQEGRHEAGNTIDGFHALRHYYASLLIRRGESVKTVQARLGHASAVETLDTYSHLWPDSDDRTRDAIDSVLGSTADPLRTEAMPNG